MNERYIRQTMIPEIGEAGQEKLKNAKVLIVGIGGLGSPISLYLTAAGVGQIGLIDDDIVSRSNLQRQILYTEAEIGQSKVECACRRLSALNSSTRFETYLNRFTSDNADRLVSAYDIIIDGCDNAATRYLIDDICSRFKSLMYMDPFRNFGDRFPSLITEVDLDTAIFIPAPKLFPRLVPEELSALFRELSAAWKPQK